MEFTYYNPVKLFHGATKIGEVAEEVKSFGDKVLLITGGESFHKNGYFDKLKAELEEKNVQVYEISGNRKPLLSTVRKGMELVNAENISSLLGIGGGVCMDLAKTIAFGVKQTTDIWDILSYAKSPDTMEHLPVGTIVTFPSSGSDMNGSTQITNDETGENAGLAEVYPNFSWQNPEYMLSIGNEALISAQMTAYVQLALGYIGLGKSDIAENTSLALMNTLLDNLDKAIADSNDVDARSTLMTTSALTVNGLTTLGKTGDWVLYPLNAIVMDYCNVAYKPCITVIFPYWIKMIYDGQEEINSYFNKAFNVVIDGREKKNILKDGLKAIFELYKKYNLPINYSEIHEVKENSEALQESLEMLGGMQSIYTELTTEKVMQMINEAIHGIEEVNNE